jgi:uncharacterized protein (UPF0332 family)
MNARDFLDLAYDLLGGTREADWRSAVSRAYYAGFHCGRDFFTAAGFAVPAEHVHLYLWRRLSNAGHVDINRAGLLMQEYRRRRNWADYDLVRAFDQRTAQDFVQNVDDVIRLINTLPTVPEAHQKVVEQMRAYEKNVLREETWGK